MATVYLKPGQDFLIQWLPARVGATGTCADAQLSWDQGDGTEGVGLITLDGFDFWVFVEGPSGRFCYDDECGN